MSGRPLVGLGTDVVDVPRFAGALARRPGLADRLFSEDELAYAAAMTSGPAAAATLAARFAAKESAMKVLGVGLGAFGWHDVEVHRRPSGAPTLVVRGRAAGLAGAAGIEAWTVSLSHTAAVATAVVAGLGGPERAFPG